MKPHEFVEIVMDHDTETENIKIHDSLVLVENSLI